MEQALQQAKKFGGPVIVHAITRKGFGYDPAERHEADQFHAPGPFDVQTGAEKPKGLIWTDHFAEHIVQIGARRPDVVAITAAMMHPVGLDKFQARFPERTFDVGIAEQHAATSAAGLAIGGLHPVVAVYATFLNRAFDQVLMDVALHKCGVTFVLDRSGVTGDDGASHNGMWDMSVLQVVPGLRLAAPRDVDPDARPARRGGRGRRRARRWCASRRDRRRPTSRRSTASAASTCCVRDGHARRARRGRRLDGRHRRRRGGAADRAGHRRHRRRPALGQAGRPGAGRARRRPPAGRDDRGQRRHRRRRRGAAADALGRRHRHPRAAARHPPGVPRPREAGRDPRARGPVGPDDRARHRARDGRHGRRTTRTRRTTGRSSMPTGSTADARGPAAGWPAAALLLPLPS